MMFSSLRSTFVSGIAASLLLLSSCQQQKPAAEAAPAAAAPTAQARYECPMGCAGSQSNKPGKCPTCEMELVKKS
ncbi:heavy metal-binding domain-containing protein [Hymenobacter convexus]|uniref:heavy metal-binding domain-containing protein n=1 Tax=Hymenobacter sp. CA1UV-4 TaxID=3063782 RepID=UPI002712957C|nr:heavy metal-binding domain-containing protein [Hymenobacter sp. CA1UV-4]MDO7851742.1 heavy metal-binding domain-containing protein [Hymenobacter sp. CA1UV-4]